MHSRFHKRDENVKRFSFEYFSPIYRLLCCRKIHRLKIENQTLKRKLKVYEDDTAVSRIKKTMNEDQYALITRLQRIREWSEESIIEGFRTKFVCGATAYDIECKKRFLPSARTLRRKLQNIHFDSGCLEEVFRLLEYKVAGMKKDDTDVAIVFDEMAIQPGRFYCSNLKKYLGMSTVPPYTEYATHLLVFMVAGLRSRWKQVIAYFFTGDSIESGCLKSILFDLIRRSEAIGLRVHAAISDCGGNIFIVYVCALCFYIPCLY